MKVYVDELPKSCIDCPCESEYYYNLLNRDIEFLELTKGCKDCPLQSLTDYTKKVRKEVYEKIKKELYNVSKTYFEDEPYIEICIIKGILDQIEKGKL